MTQHFNFSIEIKTTDDVTDDKVERTISRFIDRLSQNEKVLTSDVDIEKGRSVDLTEDERERLLSTIESIDRPEQRAAMEIAVALSSLDD
jgi:hypothetical protein